MAVSHESFKPIHTNIHIAPDKLTADVWDIVDVKRSNAEDFSFDGNEKETKRAHHYTMKLVKGQTKITALTVFPWNSLKKEIRADILAGKPALRKAPKPTIRPAPEYPTAPRK